MMRKINRLLNLIECIEELLTVRMEYERVQASAGLQMKIAQANQKIVKAHQKISLAEKKCDVKNTRSPVSSEIG
ncbi:hypothetical protein [Lysinibacillus sp. 3P01SB]|uniref:hypothetical protein n=1 Tax=Lysinibacillus sp. 3P01SB TaxID=3132284 RepID=UPI0039A4724E